MGVYDFYYPPEDRWVRGTGFSRSRSAIDTQGHFLEARNESLNSAKIDAATQCTDKKLDTGERVEYIFYTKAEEEQIAEKEEELKRGDKWKWLDSNEDFYDPDDEDPDDEGFKEYEAREVMIFKQCMLEFEGNPRVIKEVFVVIGEGKVKQGKP